MGEVTAIGKDTITVDGKTLNTADSKTYEITSKAGGSSVKAATVAVGDTVKVMVNGDQPRPSTKPLSLKSTRLLCLAPPARRP